MKQDNTLLNKALLWWADMPIYKRELLAKNNYPESFRTFGTYLHESKIQTLYLSEHPQESKVSDVKKLKTHEVLDLHYHPEEGQGCFDGTLTECNEFAATQTPDFMYKVLPMTKQQVESHPDNEWYYNPKKEEPKKPSVSVSLEDAAEIGFKVIKDKPISHLYKKGFFDGAKWQLEQSNKEIEALKQSNAELLAACEKARGYFRRLANEGKYPEFMMVENGGEGIKFISQAIDNANKPK